MDGNEAEFEPQNFIRHRGGKDHPSELETRADDMKACFKNNMNTDFYSES